MRNAEWTGRLVPTFDLKERTRALALAVVRLVEAYPRNRTGDVVGRQLLRSATSVAANYRSACRARSRRDFIAKMAIVEEEADETQFWLELSADVGLADQRVIEPLRGESGELTAIVVASIRTARQGHRAIPHSAFRIPRSS
jgi:four helix bundle protein